MSVDPIRATGDPQTRVAGELTAELFEDHSRMVYGLCRTLLRDPDDADDATQATFVSAYRSLLGGSDVREPAAWLATIARNECIGRAHARMREPLPLLEGDLGHAPGPEAELDRKDSVEELRQAIAGLPEKQREAVVLRDLYGLQYAEVSAALGMSVASVESLLFRARRSLRTSLKPLASGALVVPIAIREGIAQALPAFTTAGAAGGGAASGAVGLGVFAKLAGGPAAVKAAAGVAAAIAAGSIAVAGVERAEVPRPSREPVSASSAAAGPGGLIGGDSVSVAASVGTSSGAAIDDSGRGRTGRVARMTDDDAAGRSTVDSAGARSAEDEGAGTSGRSTRNDAKVGSRSSQDGDDDPEAPEGTVVFLETSDPSAGEDGDGKPSIGSDDASDGTGSVPITDDSDSLDDPEPDTSGKAFSFGDSGDGAVVTTPPA